VAIPWEEFFITKIIEGLAGDSNALSEQEELILMTPASELSNKNIEPEELRKLQNKCISALRNAYAKDTATKNREVMLWWRKNNEMIYKYSQLVLSGMVQEWYLTVGQSQEKKAAGCIALLVLFLFIALGVALFIMRA